MQFHHQEPYKGDLLRLCKAAHDLGHRSSPPPLTADGLRDALIGRWNGTVNPKVKGLFEDACRRWDDWLYALDQA